MTKATPESPDSLVFECDLEEPPEKVWRALTEPELLEAWLAPPERPETDSVEERPPSYEILTADPHRLVRYRWRDRDGGAAESGEHEVQSVVTVELVPGQAGGTHLRLTHGEFMIVPIAAPLTAARVRPITSARQREIRKVSIVSPRSLRRAA